MELLEMISALSAARAPSGFEGEARETAAALIAPYTDEMRGNIAGALGIGPDRVSVKATTEEHLGFTGSGEGIAAHAVCLIEKRE